MARVCPQLFCETDHTSYTQYSYNYHAQKCVSNICAKDTAEDIDKIVSFRPKRRSNKRLHWRQFSLWSSRSCLIAFSTPKIPSSWAAALYLELQRWVDPLLTLAYCFAFKVCSLNIWSKSLTSHLIAIIPATKSTWTLCKHIVLTLNDFLRMRTSLHQHKTQSFSCCDSHSSQSTLFAHYQLSFSSPLMHCFLKL